MKIRSQTVYKCISSEKFENCVDIEANLNFWKWISADSLPPIAFIARREQ